ncbi:hypothetical protein NRK67_17295 (plasmid) [Fusobacteria bacterium ZRK30]|nr:hypothetical protein NRK67_17295 [Fusobacteria bacterium ZRK30]
MINKLKQIKELRKTRKLVAEEELKRLEKDYEVENRSEKVAQRIENIKIKIDKLEKDLENLTNLEKKFKQESQATG